MTFAESDRRLAASFGLDFEQHTLVLARTGTEIRAQVVGEGPPLVFVHGGSNAGSSWANLVALLPGYRCVVVDRPGCGLSPPVPRPMTDVATFNAYADDFLADVVDALGEDAVSVVGTSFGGYFTLRGAAAHPDRVSRVVMLGWTIGAPAGAMPFVMRVGASPTISKVTSSIPPSKGAVRALLKRIGLRAAVESGTFDDQMVEWFQSLLRHTDTMRNEATASPPIVTLRGVNPAIFLTDEILSSVRAPVLWLWGRDDPFGGEGIAEVFVARLPDAELEMVPGGHAVWIDDAPGVAARVGAFLGR